MVDVQSLTVESNKMQALIKLPGLGLKAQARNYITDLEYKYVIEFVNLYCNAYTMALMKFSPFFKS